MNKMKLTLNPMRFIPILILVVAACVAVALGNLKKPPQQKATLESAPLVETATVTSCDEGFFIEVDGEVIPYRQVTLSAQVAGRITEKSPLANAGNFVEAGTMLMKIDPSDYKLEIRQLQETVKQTGVSIEEADIEKSNIESLIVLTNRELELQISDVKRYEGLAKRNAGSGIQLDAAKRAELTTRNALQTRKNEILLVEARKNRLLRQKEQALVNLEKATLDLSRTIIKSPLDGVVMSDEVEQDDFVQPGTALVSVEDTSKVEIRFNLRMEQMRWLWGETNTDLPQNNYYLPPVDVYVFVELDGHQYKWTARLSRYDGASINPITRTVPCIAIVDDPSAGQLLLTDHQSDFVADLPVPPTLLRGTFVSLKIPVTSKLDLVQVPTISLRPGNKVWVAENSKLVVKDVRVAHAGTDSIVLITGPEQLRAGSRVITSPLPILVDGMEIRDENAETLTSTEAKREAF
jgi:multidrug efflux pump subunit AcrA (membrane-fusion protein)